MIEIIFAILVVLVLIGLWVRDDVTRKVRADLKKKGLDFSGIVIKRREARFAREKMEKRIGKKYKMVHSAGLIILALAALYTIIADRSLVFYSFIILAVWTGVIPRIYSRIVKVRIKKDML